MHIGAYIWEKQLGIFNKLNKIKSINIGEVIKSTSPLII